MVYNFSLIPYKTTSLHDKSNFASFRDDDFIRAGKSYMVKILFCFRVVFFIKVSCQILVTGLSSYFYNRLMSNLGNRAIVCSS